MDGFKKFVLMEGQINDDIATLCNVIINGPDSAADVSWDSIIQILEPVNRKKAEFVRIAVENNDMYIMSRLSFTGQFGFITADSNLGYRDFIRNVTTPELGIWIRVAGVDGAIEAFIPFKRAICLAAAERQMGVAEYIGNDVNVGQLDLSGLWIEKIDGKYKHPEKENSVLLAKVHEKIVQNDVQSFVMSNTLGRYFVLNDFEDGERETVLARNDRRYKDFYKS